MPRQKFIEWLKGLFIKQAPTGLILDDAQQIASLPQYHLLFGATDQPPTDWTYYCPPFRNQGSSWWCTAYTGTAIGSIFEKKETGNTVVFSPMELFYRTGGLVSGNSASRTAEGMKKSLVLEKDVPTIVPDGWGLSYWSKASRIAGASQDALERGKRYAVKSYVNVTPDKSSLRQALVKSPLAVVIGVGKGYWNDPAPAVWDYSAYHLVVLVKIEPDGRYKIFDSLAPRAGFDGFHHLASNYPILHALAFVDLPDDWQGRQIDNIKLDNKFALDHYGEKRILIDEQYAASKLNMESKEHPEIAALLGKDWLVYVNACAYGGYSVQDVVNHCFSIRRGKGPIFDFSHKKL